MQRRVPAVRETGAIAPKGVPQEGARDSEPAGECVAQRPLQGGDHVAHQGEAEAVQEIEGDEEAVWEDRKDPPVLP